MPFAVPSWAIKLACGLLAALALFLLVQNRNHWKRVATERQAQLAAICGEVRDAAGNPKMDCGQAVRQIRELGTSLRSTTGALQRQNASVKALNAETVRQQKQATDARKRASQRANAAESAAQRLAASAAHGASGAACEPSETLKEAWK
jgi:hypothetical protein